MVLSVALFILVGSSLVPRPLPAFRLFLLLLRNVEKAGGEARSGVYTYLCGHWV